MAASIFESIKKALISLFKGLYPAFDVFCEEIPKTQNDEPEPDLEDYVFLEVIPTGNTTADPYHTDRMVLVSVAIHTKSESNQDYLKIFQEVDGAVRPVFRFQDGGEARAITVPDISFRVVDKVLQVSFTLAFRDSIEESPQLPVMEDLEMFIKTTERT